MFLILLFEKIKRWRSSSSSQQNRRRGKGVGIKVRIQHGYHTQPEITPGHGVYTRAAISGNNTLGIVEGKTNHSQLMARFLPAMQRKTDSR